MRSPEAGFRTVEVSDDKSSGWLVAPNGAVLSWASESDGRRYFHRPTGESRNLRPNELRALDRFVAIAYEKCKGDRLTQEDRSDGRYSSYSPRWR
ncbi:hypothetical protein A2631_05550 [Candidatus Daviesbacteria bacterium RIFCSPHIGHO2_01_FULL_44_29]|uniref:Uncharacterized protein n=1 Tax=Candidatus Daviesbacteria bacterium RIFCSPHIGHO2_02_FULL_43_12 TaxID=1797776 RepID=A0A1F5KI28_9BACT|nr:MAG: hypothetical protein A2631_05550 [Candidatus Daviesbacteria bacterium RIFCSPHIGHO2_01_FULL_44_29]OGE39211.1 MAG: hypothetical protein A3E86_01295 [Candidatus Daviesbacteria bacterium RIFCSPHIGHO2_12_FULL_47_45]OGE40586.1 MAG: hypothetical protein A3D25_00515 [Candidatus Daviesbacteria bacterium RIFCSPHIGHO2_02_FULL_43_12]OGE70146.1 MAG: hypothetical protein A3B55_00285 [Candidatus Daviesbacteria bacterium RIFCSPLOWO2_01_FULL_43_15]